ncbi:inorganic phosphate transporter [Candidatus Margulisiibacteriota bacterium]
MEWILLIAIVIGFYMAWNIGANDVANSMANAVGSKAITIIAAVILAGICEFAGAVLVGGHVTNTIRKGIIDTQAFVHNPQVLAYGLICALLAAAVWLNVASHFGMPVSTTHSIVGAITGFGLVYAGMANVQWVTLGKIVASWFISPVIGGFIAFLVFKFISNNILSKEKPILAAVMGVPICIFLTFTTIILATIFKGLKNLNLDLSGLEAIGISVFGGLVAAVVSYFIMQRIKNRDGEASLAEQLAKVEKVFVLPVIITSCAVAFAHGANDVANAVGPLAAVFEIVKTNQIPSKVSVDMWVLVLGGTGIVAGLATFGYKVMQKVGLEITDITPTRGVAADIGAMITVLACSKMGLPISTTHTLVGAIIGVAMARGIATINIDIVKSIFTSWFATVPIAAGLSALFYTVFRLVSQAF